MRTGIILSIAGLVFLAGCGNKPPSAPAKPKVQTPPYQLAFDDKAPKPNPVGVTIPIIKYTAKPDSVEKRAILVVRFDASSATKTGPLLNQMIMYPVDMTGVEGALPVDYMNAADKDLTRFLGAYCIKGKVKITVALARSSLSPQAAEGDVDAKRLSDWVPVEVDFKNPHPKC